MANGQNAVATVTPVLATENKDTVKMTEVKVTVIEGKEFVAILSNEVSPYIKAAFKLQDSHDNESTFQRDALMDGAILVFKTTCQRAIGTWDNLVTKMSKLPKYGKYGRPELENLLKTHPKCKDIWLAAKQAAEHKANGYRLD